MLFQRPSFRNTEKGSRGRSAAAGGGGGAGERSSAGARHLEQCRNCTSAATARVRHPCVAP
jgi:hypothetical protein